MELACEAEAISEEAIINVKTVAACNGQNTMVAKFEKALKAARKPVVAVSFISSFFEGMMFMEQYIWFTSGIVWALLDEGGF